MYLIKLFYRIRTNKKFLKIRLSWVKLGSKWSLKLIMTYVHEKVKIAVSHSAHGFHGDP